jgi:O-antigen/teichoic acid export membrane protein
MPLSDQNIPRKSHFTLNVLTLAAGTTISQIISLLASPIITRLYGPEAFGLFAVFTSIIAVIGSIVCLRYELAIMLPESDEEAANVLGLCILTIFTVSILSVPILAISDHFLEMILKSSQIGNYIWLIPPSIFLSGSFLVLNYWNTRTEKFRRLAIAQIMKSCSYTGTELGFGFTGYVTGGFLIGAFVIGQLVSTFALGIQIVRDDLSFFRKNITAKGTIAVMKRYSNFPKYDTWSILLGNISMTLPVFILTAYFSPTIVGFYSLACMAIAFPLGFVEDAIAQVFFQRAAEAKNFSPEKLKETVLQTIKPLIFCVFFPVILVILCGPELFSVVFGAQWAEAGNFVRFLSIWIAIGFVASPISTLFSIFQKQRLTLFLNVIEIIIQISALVIGAWTGSALTTIILFSFTASVSTLVGYFYLLRLSGISILVPAKTVSNFVLITLPFIFCFILFKAVFSPNIWLSITISILISSLLPLLVIMRDPELFNVIKGVTSSIPIINKYL